ncbi:FecR family protein [Gracilimonas tropica]|uniref:FecR family protein n=1 Tax=Gracilimonas tropica TaxID=454600 RepID=UPI00036B1F45|nr:FecR domain-containing protein [Gracilimonas tropica]
MDINLLSKYITGECSASEKKQVEKWAYQSPGNREYLEDLKKIWSYSGQKNYSSELFNTEMDWTVLKNRIEDEALVGNIKTTASRSKFSLNSTWSVLMRVAAIFLISGLFGFYTFKSIYVPVPEVQETVLRDIFMPKGKRGGVTLSDGSKVFLNADSRITIPTVFTGNVREVYLEGEAYFDVVENPNRPFIIKTRGAVVQVLGTSFAIRNYSDDKTVRTVVEDGVVSFKAEGAQTNDGVILTKGKLGKLDLNSKRMITEEVNDLDIYLSWKEGNLKFDDTKMTEVAKQLERRYDIKVEMSNESIGDLHLTAELRSRSMDNVIHTIATSLDLDYVIDQQKHKVIFQQ